MFRYPKTLCTHHEYESMASLFTARAIPFRPPRPGFRPGGCLTLELCFCLFFISVSPLLSVRPFLPPLCLHPLRPPSQVPPHPHCSSPSAYPSIQNFIYLLLLNPHSQRANYFMNAYRRRYSNKEASAWLEGTPAIHITCLYVSWYEGVVDTHSILKCYFLDLS